MFRSIRDREEKEARRVSATGLTGRRLPNSVEAIRWKFNGHDRVRSKWIRSSSGQTAAEAQQLSSQIGGGLLPAMSVKHPHPSPPHRRPPGFASAIAPSAGSTPPRRREERERGKERTKLRERHCPSVTSRMFTGLRQHGNFPPLARADMNDVLAGAGP
jgi:hypothetical protein